nr:hypothetical protein [Burkholderia multivorans]
MSVVEITDAVLSVYPFPVDKRLTTPRPNKVWPKRDIHGRPSAGNQAIRPSRLHAIYAASAVRAASIHVASTIAAAFPGVDPSSCGA